MAAKFDRFMVAVELASNPKIGRLTDAEFRCLVAGVWPLAAKAPIRGRLLIGQLEIEPRDIAHQSRCSEIVAKNTLEKLRRLGMIEPDPEFGCERIHDWDDLNPQPRKDNTAAERQQRRRDKVRDKVRDAGRDDRDGHGVTKLRITPTEVEVEVEVETPLPPEGESSVTLIAPVKPKGNRSRDLAGWQAELDAWVSDHFPGCEPKAVEKVVDWVRSHGDDPTPDAVRAFAAAAPTFAHLLEPAA